MIKLTASQADTLFKIVQFANKNGGRIPTGPEFAKILDIGTRAASARINRILKRTNFSYRDGRSSYINYDQLITEKETAQLCLTILDVSQNGVQGRVSSDEIAKILNLSYNDCLDLIKKYCQSGYISTIGSGIQAYRAGQKIFNHYEYLKLLATS